MSNRQRDRGLIWPPGSAHFVTASGQHIRVSFAQERGQGIPWDRIRRFLAGSRALDATPIDNRRGSFTRHRDAMAKAKFYRTNVVFTSPMRWHEAMADASHARTMLTVFNKRPVAVESIGSVVATYYHDKTTETWHAGGNTTAEAHEAAWPAAVANYRERHNLAADHPATLVANTVAARIKRPALKRGEVIKLLQRVAAGEDVREQARHFLVAIAA